MSYAEENVSVHALFEVSLRGSVSELETLIGRGPLILHKLSLTTFIETPLHISALLGYLDFTKSLITSPKLLPHLASAEGHVDVVHVLLQRCEDACLMSDQDGRIPLHYAAMRGLTDMVRELIRTRPESLMTLDGSEKAMLHLCVEHNHLKTLKTLVGEGHISDNFLNVRDFYRGNTILHLAVMLKQIENKMGHTALDMLEHTPKDMRSLQMKVMLMDSGIKNNGKLQVDHPPSTTIVIHPSMTTVNPNEKYRSKFLKRINKFLKLKSDGLEKMRGMLSMVVSQSSVTWNKRSSRELF
ncbi:hypothetical protein VNO78_06835 [Psophocarpus tetragonolobus]|uniref:Uncharacterized protein n=1 Tax=Psophocarpus tetragonolobus TaxID=3891 RepID=A0AAN9SSW2_PSOTE